MGEWVDGSLIDDVEEERYVRVGETPVDLLELNGSEMTSPVFQVGSNGSGVLLQMFRGCTDVLVEMVKIDTMDMPHGGPDCCSCKVEMFQAMKSTCPSLSGLVGQMDEGGAKVWAITPTDNLGLITVPGSYRLIIPKGECSEVINICARLIPPEGVQAFPAPLIFGNL